jgi:hypothetical protein
MVMQSNPVYVKYITNYPEYSRNLEKYLDFINQIYSSSAEANAYLESVATAEYPSVICIYKDYETFIRILPELKEDFRSIILSYAMNEQNFLLEGIEDGSKFPKEGFKIKIEMISHKAHELFPSFKAFYGSMHPNIHVSLIDDNLIEIHMRDFASFRTYTNVLYGCTRLTEKK